MRSQRRGNNRQQGTASVEAVLMLPLFILMFASLYLMHGHFSGRQQALSRARACLWDYASRGCPTDDSAVNEHKACLTPAGITPAEVAVADDKERPDGRFDPTLGNRVSDVLKKIEAIPVLGDMVAWMFGKPIGATGYAMVQLPAYALPERERFVAAGTYFTMCNSVPKSWGDVGKQIFCSFVGAGTFGCPKT